MSKDAVRKLVTLAAKPVNLTRGFHYCQFCARDPSDRFRERHPRGNGEIRVLGTGGIEYAAPTLICHYIEIHEYRPPDEFVEAVESLPESPKIAIVAALERELRPLVHGWRVHTIEHDGRQFGVYESSYATVICGGIGPEAARRAAEAVIANYSPQLLISAGFAGSLVSELHVGETIFPATVVDVQDGSRHDTAIEGSPVANTALGRTVLVCYPEIAGAEQKQKLAKSYGAHAVDMESAAVALAARVHNLRFLAIKAISDDLDSELPEMSRFIRHGQFRTSAFVLHVAVRPWLWLQVFRLARNTRIASENLCAWLRESALTNTIVSGTITPKT